MDNSGPKYLEPEIFFKKKKICLADTEEMVTVSQLVRKGDQLAGFPKFFKLRNRGFMKSPIVAGKFVELSENENFLVASASGYPKAHFTEAEEGPDTLTISIVPVVKVSHDKMKASVVIHPSIPECASVNSENISDIISESGVIYGIDEDSVEKIKTILDGEDNDFEDILFAKGTLPGEGTDASLHYELEIGPLAGHRLEDGSIDFRDRKIMVGISKGTHIATKIPAIPGEPGHNVYGDPIESKKGKDFRVLAQGGAKFFPEENKVLATEDGALSIVNNRVIKVTTRNVIAGDVDYKTGNVETEANASIVGSVLPKFKVNVGGDLQIKQGVSGGAVHCDGNCVIQGGITGTTSYIEVKGDLDINFIERGTIKSGGVVVIRKQSYYSTIEAASDIRCHKSSKILGGTLISGGNVTLGDVGAENCDPALIAAGVDPERYQLYLELKQQYSEQQEELIQTLQLTGRGGRPKKIRKMEEAADEIRLKILKLNLIPGTELYSRFGEGKDRDDLEEEDPIYLDSDIENIRVEVYGKMYAGTKILLGNRTAILSQDINNRQYRLSKNLKRIMAIPLK